MKNLLVLTSVVAVVMLSLAPAQAMAQDPEGGNAVMQSARAWTLVNLSGAFGCGLVVIGASYGIGRLAGSALESMARQPEVAGNIQVAMIIAAALIEGFTFFALYICMTQNPFPAAG